MPLRKMENDGRNANFQRKAERARPRKGCNTQKSQGRREREGEREREKGKKGKKKRKKASAPNSLVTRSSDRNGVGAKECRNMLSLHVCYPFSEFQIVAFALFEEIRGYIAARERFDSGSFSNPKHD